MLPMTVEYHRVAPGRLGKTVRRYLVVLYYNYGMVRPCDSDWLQHTMNALVRLFRMYGLAANIAKSCKITCKPGALRVGMSDEAMSLK